MTEVHDRRAMDRANKVVQLARQLMAAIEQDNLEQAAACSNTLFALVDAENNMVRDPSRPAQVIAGDAANMAVQRAWDAAEAFWWREHGYPPPEPPPGWRP